MCRKHIGACCHFWSAISRVAWDRDQLLTHLHHLKQRCGLDMWPGALSHKSLRQALPVSHYRSWWRGCSHSRRCLWPFSARRHLRGKWAWQSLFAAACGESHLYICVHKKLMSNVVVVVRIPRETWHNISLFAIKAMTFICSEEVFTMPVRVYAAHAWCTVWL